MSFFRELKQDSGEPQIRAAQVQNDLRTLQRMGIEPYERVLAQLDPEWKLQAETATRMAWLSVEIEIDLMTTVDRVLGPEELWQWSRLGLLESFRGALLGPLVQGGIRLFGLNPGKLLKLTPRAWTQVYRNCGEMELVQAGASSARLIHQVTNERILSCETFHRSLSGSFSAVYAVCELQGGEVTFQVTSDHVVYEFNW